MKTNALIAKSDTTLLSRIFICKCCGFTEYKAHYLDFTNFRCEKCHRRMIIDVNLRRVFGHWNNKYYEVINNKKVFGVKI